MTNGIERNRQMNDMVGFVVWSIHSVIIKTFLVRIIIQLLIEIYLVVAM